MGKPSCRDVSTPPLRPLPSLSSLPPLCSLPAPTHTLRQRYRRGQLLAVGANALGLAQSVDLRLSDDSLPRLVFEVDIGELLPVVVLHDEIRFAFFNGPGRREAAGGHCLAGCTQTAGSI